MYVDKIKNHFKKCSFCRNSGMVTGRGGINSNCSECWFKRTLLKFINEFWSFLTNQPIQKYPVGFMICAFFFYYLISKNFSELMRDGSLIGILGLLFAALKHKLDQANYQKSLFEERYKLFCQIEEIIIEANQMDINYERLRKFDEIVNRCQFLFGKITLNFIIEVRSHFVNLIYLKKNGKNSTPEADEAIDFFASLITLRVLPSKFPELIISNY